jgi:hypothetical protein
MTLPTTTLDDFQNLCKKDIRAYFDTILNFLATDYNDISNFYIGKASTIKASSFKNLDFCKQETATVLSLFDQFGSQMNNLKWWDLLEKIENVDNQLKTLSNINRWARASSAKVGYNPTIQFDHVLKQNETLERVAQDILGRNDSQDSWYDIAINNGLVEEDYTSQGGAPLKLAIDNGFSTGFQINSIVDMISSSTIYGKDLNRYLEIDETSNDLVVLGYDDTIMQAIEILATLKKNDNPDFPTHGLQSTVIIGGTRAGMNFPLISRQMAETFSNDDSLKNFAISSISIDEDNLYVNFTISTRLGETKDLKVQLS